MIILGLVGENSGMAQQQDKFDAANPPDELYGVARPDPDLAPATPAMEPIIPQVVREDGEDEDRATGSRFDFDSFRENFRFQFTLSELFMVTTALAVLLSIMSLLRWKWQLAAGLAGVGAFVSLLVITIVEPERRVVQTIWWSFLVFYLLACLVAVFTGG